jgi:hypothetical protein
MMNLPDGFSEEYAVMRERFEWAHLRGSDLDVPAAKLAVEDIDGFLQRWRGKVGIPEMETGMSAVAAWVERMNGQFDLIFLSHLREVVEARREWLVAELTFKAEQQCIWLIQHGPPQLRPGLEQIHREHMGREFDPAVEFRETEAHADQRERQYRQALAGLEVDWPERLTPQIRQRFAQPEPADFAAWVDDLNEKASALKTRLDAVDRAHPDEE